MGRQWGREVVKLAINDCLLPSNSPGLSASIDAVYITSHAACARALYRVAITGLGAAVACLLEVAHK